MVDGQLSLVIFHHSLFTDLHNTNGVHHTIRRGYGQSSLGHQLANQGGSVGTGNSRLHSHSNKAVGVIQCLPGVSRDLGTHIFRVSTAFVPRLELRAVVHQELNNLVSALHGGAHERCASVTVRPVRIQTQVEQHFHGFH